MADRPILFSDPMIRALLEGRKTQTRRILKPQPECGYAGGTPYFSWNGYTGLWPDDWQHAIERNVRIAPGDRLYVKETWRAHGWHADCVEIAYAAQRGLVGWSEQHEQIKYPVGDPHLPPLRNAFKYYAPKGQDFWRPSIHMPRWASRITLTVTDVRVERLQDISDRGPQNDCTAEGVFHCGMSIPSYEVWHGDGFRSSEKHMYRTLWNSINGAGSWESNPWIVAYSFSVHLGNIDQIGRRT